MSIRLALLATIAFLSSPLACGAAPSVVMPESARGFFQKHCVSCHGPETQEGKVRLDDIPLAIDDLPTATLWQKVLDALNSGEMPPEDEIQPSIEDKTAFLETLSHTMVAARRALSDQGGVITMRRLNRREFENTLRDLLGVEIDAKTLPTDLGTAGFDTAGGSLFMSSDQFEQYLNLARAALDEVLVPLGERPQKISGRRECEVDARKKLDSDVAYIDREMEKHRRIAAGEDPKKFGFDDRSIANFLKDLFGQRTPLYERLMQDPMLENWAPLTIYFGHICDNTKLPADAPPGNYVMRAKIAVLPGTTGRRRFVEFGRDQRNTGLGKHAYEVFSTHMVSGTPDEPQLLEIPFTVTANGPRLVSLRERQTSEKPINAYRRQKVEDEWSWLPRIWVDSVEWEGPFVEIWPPAAWSRIFFKPADTPQDTAYAREIIERFAARAFRGRAIAPEFLDKLTAIYQQRREGGAGFEQALRDPLAIVLASPSFLYLLEPLEGKPLIVSDTKSAEARKHVALSGIELANRLSYFLWSAPPDDALLELGRNGELLKPEVLARETDRLLADDRSHEFVTGFLSQWLHMDRLDFFQFNPVLYENFDPSAKIAARDEVLHTFATVLREDLPLRTLLKSDFLVVNDVMADYYGIDGVTTSAFQKVSVLEGSPRGGLLGMAAILAMGSDGERSSPVERGAFVLRKILDNPPPPAPPNVPQLSRLAGRALPARELLSAHMEQAQCAQCHRRIDPIGYGLENFDAAGRWRTAEIVIKRLSARRGESPISKEPHFPIDPSGQLPDGAAFDDFFGLRDAIAERHEIFARGLTRSLIEYGLGRPFSFSDEALADDMLAAAAPKQHTPRALIHALVQSRLFQTK